MRNFGKNPPGKWDQKKFVKKKSNRALRRAVNVLIDKGRDEQIPSHKQRDGWVD